MIPTPNSELYLLSNVELDPDYNFTIDFDSKEAQQNYFNSKISSTLLNNEDYSFIRTDESIKIQASIEDLDGINYLMFKNDTRWHYCFIVKKQYVSQNVTRLILKYDVFQTFMFDFEIAESFIDREHQDRYNTDGTPIYNTQEENLNYGKKYILKTTSPVKNNNIVRNNVDGSLTTWRDGYILLLTSVKLTGDKMPDNVMDGNFLDVPYFAYAFPIVEETKTLNGKIKSKILMPCTNNNVELSLNGSTDKVVMKDFGKLLKAEELKTSSVLGLYYTPYLDTISSIEDDSGIPVFKTNNIQNIEFSFLRGTSATMEKDTFPCIRVLNVDQNGNFKVPVELNFGLATGVTKLSPNALRSQDVEPKLFTNPYFFFQLDNQQCEPLTFYNEFLGNNYLVNINVKSVVNIQPKWCFSIENYLGANNLYEAMIDTTINDLPLMNDAYLQYMTQNKASATAGIAVAGAQTLAGLTLGALTGGIGLAVAGSSVLSFAGQIANELVKREDLKQTPDTIKNVGNNGLFTLGSYFAGVNVKIYSITDEFRDKIYSYFFHFGYKCNDFKKPNVRSRYYFNYIKTIGANIKTNIDAEYKNSIASIFDNGITIWHFRDVSTFKGVNNYEYENAEMALI